jgi:ABC-2 type transport system ATP-binding protein
MKGIIKVKNLTKKYGALTAVKNATFNVEEGTITGFVGKNGAGKSTTLKAMMNMIFPTEGTIKIKGFDAIKDTKKIKEIVAYMSSDINYYENLKVIDLFNFSLNFSNKTNEDVDRLVKYFQINPQKKISQLSLGNKKKVSIILNFLKEADIIILDEPTSGLDPLMQEKFFKLILKEKKEGKTIFLSSHNLAEIEKYCDTVIIIKDGLIVETIDMKKEKEQLKQVITYKTKDNKKATYEFDGDVNDLVKELSTKNLKDLEIRTKTIEEEFMGYYKGEEDE